MRTKLRTAIAETEGEQKDLLEMHLAVQDLKQAVARVSGIR
jgi:hypothetical protein